MTARPLATTSLQCSRGHGSVHRTGSRGQPRDKRGDRPGGEGSTPFAFSCPCRKPTGYRDATRRTGETERYGRRTFYFSALVVSSMIVSSPSSSSHCSPTGSKGHGPSIRQEAVLSEYRRGHDCPASSDLVRLSSSMTAARVPLLAEGGIDGVADLDAATLVGRLVKACPAYDQPPLRGEDQASDPDRRQRVSVNLGCTTLPGRAPCGHHVVGQPKLRGPLGTARTADRHRGRERQPVTGASPTRN